jgi:hypothetical protein
MKTWNSIRLKKERTDGTDALNDLNDLVDK